MPYCCIDFGPSGCRPGGNFACPTDTSAYTCADGGSLLQAIPSLVCNPSSGLANGDVGYCCGAGACVSRGNVEWPCTDASTLYECPGSAAPTPTGALTCADWGSIPGQTATPTTEYCCTPGPCSPSIASPASSLSPGCDTPGAMAFGCAGATTPAELDPALYCDSLPASGNLSQYCCYQSTCGSASVTNCGAGQTAVLCTGTAMPATQFDPTLTSCSVSSTPDPHSTIYCCN